MTNNYSKSKNEDHVKIFPRSKFVHNDSYSEQTLDTILAFSERFVGSTHAQLPTVNPHHP